MFRMASFPCQNPAMKKPRRLIARRGSGDGFSDLPLPLQKDAQWEFNRLCQRWERHLSLWRIALLVGRARWIVLHPECRTSEWGKRLRRGLLAKWGRKGGLATQRQYREEGRTGPNHPAIYAGKVSVSRRKWQKQKAHEQELVRKGFPPNRAEPSKT